MNRRGLGECGPSGRRVGKMVILMVENPISPPGDSSRCHSRNAAWVGMYNRPAEQRIRSNEASAKCGRDRFVVQVPTDSGQLGQSINGFRTERTRPNRPKSRSADQSSRTPCAEHSAAILASCTIEPITFPVVSTDFSWLQ